MKIDTYDLTVESASPLDHERKWGDEITVHVRLERRPTLWERLRRRKPSPVDRTYYCNDHLTGWRDIHGKPVGNRLATRLRRAYKSHSFRVRHYGEALA